MNDTPAQAEQRQALASRAAHLDEWSRAYLLGRLIKTCPTPALRVAVEDTERLATIPRSGFGQ